MKRCLFIAIISLSFLKVHSQDATKAETIEWLNGKLSQNLLTGRFHDCVNAGDCVNHYYSSVNIYTGPDGDYIRFTGKFDNNDYDYIIFLKDITRATFCDDPANKAEFCSDYSQPAFVLHYKGNERGPGKKYFPVDWSAEDDLQKRFKKAFDYLLTFYRTKTQEKF